MFANHSPVQMADGSTVFLGDAIVIRRQDVTKMVDSAGNLTIIQEEGQPLIIPRSQAVEKKSRSGQITLLYPDGSVAEFDTNMNCESVAFSMPPVTSRVLYSSYQSWDIIAKQASCRN